MSFATDDLAQLDCFAQSAPMPRVRALHLPPDPAPGEARGEFCAFELDDGSLGLSYVLLGGRWVIERAAYIDALRRGAVRAGPAQKVAITPSDYPGFEALLARARGVRGPWRSPWAGR